MRSDASHFEKVLADALAGNYQVARDGDEGYDLRTADTRDVIEVKVVQGTRDLHAALVQLAIALTKLPPRTRGTLVAQMPRMSAARIAQEWQAWRRTLARAIRDRIRVVAAASDGLVVLPREEEPGLLRLAEAVRKAAGELKPPDYTLLLPASWTPKLFQIWVVLLDAWLRREGPLEVQEIARRAGASAPTMANSLRELEVRGDAERTRGRRAVLSRLSGRTLQQVLVRADEFRRTRRFMDESGRRDTRDLERRLRAMGPKQMAMGGVIAARHYVPRFDLHGLPRVDIAVAGREPLGWLARVDPALREARPGDPAPVLVVYQVHRPASLFDDDREGKRGFAAPADTLLDLHDLRLTEQAADFVRTMRGDA